MYLWMIITESWKENVVMLILGSLQS